MITTARFEIYERSALNCATVEMTEEFQQIVRTKTSDVEGWLTQSQIAKLYASEMLAAEIVKAKSLRPGHSKPHPEVPDCAAARLYLVRISNTKTEEIEQMQKQGACCRKEQRFSDRARDGPAHFPRLLC